MSVVPTFMVGLGKFVVPTFMVGLGKFVVPTFMVGLGKFVVPTFMVGQPMKCTRASNACPNLKVGPNQLYGADLYGQPGAMSTSRTST
jgi:hypothetical protein